MEQNAAIALLPGAELPALHMPPVTRQMLAVYCGASGDHNPVHVDIDFARAAGLGDVIAHGMLVMAWMGRSLSDHFPQPAIREFNTRFMAMTRVGNAITCRAQVTARDETPDGIRLRFALTATDQHGEVKAHGDATVMLSGSAEEILR